jgi:hypothetical protein
MDQSEKYKADLQERLKQVQSSLDHLNREKDLITRMLDGTEKEYVPFFGYDTDQLRYIRVGSKVGTKYGDDYTITHIGPVDQWNQRLLTFKETDKQLDTSRISYVYPDDHEIHPREYYDNLYKEMSGTDETQV